MKRITSLICLLLTLLMLFSLVSCDLSDFSDLFEDLSMSGTTDEDEEETPKKKDKDKHKGNDEEETVWVDTYEPIETDTAVGHPSYDTTLDYGGHDIIFLAKVDSNGYMIDFTDNKNNYSVVGQEMYKVQSQVEKELNVKLVFHKASNDDHMYSLVYNTITSGDTSMDITNISQKHIGRLAMQGCFADLDNDRFFPYFSFNSYYWGNHWVEQYNEAATVNRDLYSIAGNANLSLYKNSPAITVNREILAEFGIGDIGTLYKYVESGKWTWEKCAEMSKAVGSDRYYGLSTTQSTAYELMFADCELSDGTVLKTSLDQRAFDLWEMLSSFYQIPNGVYLTADSSDKTFTNGKSLFGVYTLGQLGDVSARVNIGVLPIPKYDETQEDYNSGAVMFDATSVLATSDSYEAVSAVLEKLNSHARSGTMSAFLNECIGYCNIYTYEQSLMFDEIFHGYTFDVSDIYGYDVNVRSELANSIKNGCQLDSTYAENRAIWNSNLNNIYTAIFG